MSIELKSPVIRPVAQTDFERWLPLWEGYNKFYGRAGSNALSDDITQMTWKRFLDSSEPMYALVAEVDGRLEGLAHYLFHRNTSMLAHTCYLQDLFTREEVRGNGIGKALINAVYDQAKLGGAVRVYWQTHETNSTAMALYNQVAERSGFLVYRKDLSTIKRSN